MSLKSLIIFLLVTSGISAAVAQESDTDSLPLAKIATVVAPDASVQRTFFGRVVAKETVDLAFQVGGQLLEFPVSEGDFLSKGDMIAKLDPEPFELSLDQAKTQLDQAQRTFDRLKRLEGSTVSQVSVDDAQTQLELAEISLRDAERSQRMATLTAPFDALVASRASTTFSTIGAGVPVVRLHDMTETRVEINVPELLFQQAGENPDVSLTAKFPASDTLYPIEVREYNAETGSVGQTFQITLGMAPPEGLIVLPGSSVTVYANLGGKTSAPILPHSAIITGNDGTAYAMVFTPTGADTGQVTRTAIDITPNGRGEIEVVAGLEPGQEIVASGADRLEDGRNGAPIYRLFQLIGTRHEHCKTFY